MSTTSVAAGPADPPAAPPPGCALTVVAGSRSYDVVVDEHLTVGAVLELVLGAHGVDAVFVAGQVVPTGQTLAEAGVRTGSVLVAAVAGAAYQRPGRDLDGAATGGSGPGRTPAGMPPAPARAPAPVPVPPAPGAGSSRAEMAAMGPTSATGPAGAPTPARASVAVGPAALAALAAVLAGLGGYAVALAPAQPTGSFGATLRLVVLLGMLLAGFALGQLRVDPVVGHTAPVLGASAGAAAGWLGSGNALVAVVTGCGAAALVALAGRTGLGVDRRVPHVWAGAAAVVGALALAALAVGAQVGAVAALLLAVLALLVRVLPAWVIDVEDTVLVDIARLSVTSWSPRERRRRPRSVWRIDSRGVTTLVGTAMTTHTAALLGLVLLSWAAAAYLGVQALSARATWSWAHALLLASAAASLALAARSFRRRADRVALRVAALGPALAVGVPALATLSWPVAGAVAGSLAVVAVVLVRVSQAVAGGYASLGLARLADALDALATVAVLPLALWAAGALDWSQRLLT